ncbi:LacI family DNA-binding transcriptional regulator [Halotalea alkalilenta]|uniref:LacI family transcriptional regulator n=1 Tax=Halotalea alkalilenta TaxID=376489 RepID=A0A172YJ72_9GAMM|nr:LacI family DNA-binding transcriptional regulator [Halotalea alkalilenta]ANF59212.1 LacI family transcriptional regulator [Halotalea alkalilenta]
MARQRNATIADIAERVGLTSITVSRALSKPELVKASTRERILSAARELGYVPNAFARGLKQSDSRLIGIVAASIDNPFYIEMIKTIGKEAKRRGYAIMLFDTDGEERLEATAIETLLSYRVAGIILSPVSDALDYRPEYLDALVASQVAVVHLDRALARTPFDAVVLDNHEAGWRAGHYLLERLADGDLLLAVGGPARSRITLERLAGIRRAIEQSGREIVLDVVESDYTLEPAREAVDAYLAGGARPQAVFCFNQLITFGALQALKAYGYAHDDLPLVCIDRLPYLDIFDLRVPSIVHDGHQAGLEALALLFERLESPRAPSRTVTVVGELVD